MLLLTDALLKQTPVPAAGKRKELADARCVGLAFRITNKDARSFCFRFRDPKAGRSVRVNIGSYPDVSLSQARQRANALREQVASGINPAEQRRRERATAASRAFAAVAERYLEEHARRHKRKSSADADERNLRLHVLPKWKNRAMEEIDRADVIELVEEIVKGGKRAVPKGPPRAWGGPVIANRVQALISKVFAFAVDAGISKINPCIRLKKRGAERTVDRVLSDDEIRLFWKRCMVSPVSPRTGLALRLALLTATRAGEVAGLGRDELENLDQSDRAVWLIPGARTKNGRDHAVPLSDMACDAIKSALALIGPEKEFVFAAGVKRGGAMSPHALAVAMRRMTGALEGAGADTWEAEPPTPHDLRRTAATRLASLGAVREDISAILNHVRRDITGRVYDRYDRLIEKRRALAAWEIALSSILHNGPAS
ncbi:MAG: tyrosine-type recombinase/integrase [Xanthobacteraceae bacterium]